MSRNLHALPAPDPLDAAIQKATAPTSTAMIALLNNPARPAQLVVPSDITEMELLGLINAVLQIGDQLRAARPSARILVPQ